MVGTFLRALVGTCALVAASSASAQNARPARPANTDRIDIEYVAPKSPEHQPVLELVKEHRTLEKIKQLLSPMRLPRRLLIKTQGCDGVSNAWYDDGVVTVCYEYLDDVWKNVPEETTPAGVAPIDALIGPVMDVFLHEAGHAVFDMLQGAAVWARGGRRRSVLGLHHAEDGKGRSATPDHGHRLSIQR